MKVYHGSYTKIDTIDLGRCEPNKDFGQGFYVTKIYGQAVTWANRKGRDNHTKGVITEFNFFERAFSDKNYNTLRFDSYNNEWLDFVVLNRDFNRQPPAHARTKTRTSYVSAPLNRCLCLNRRILAG